MKYILNYKDKSEQEVWEVIPRNGDEKHYVILYEYNNILYYQDVAIK